VIHYYSERAIPVYSKRLIEVSGVVTHDENQAACAAGADLAVLWEKFDQLVRLPGSRATVGRSRC